jgi:hypothetical protein
MGTQLGHDDYGERYTRVCGLFEAFRVGTVNASEGVGGSGRTPQARDFANAVFALLDVSEYTGGEAATEGETVKRLGDSCERLLWHLAEHPGDSADDLKRAVPGRSGTLDTALDTMLATGEVEQRVGRLYLGVGAVLGTDALTSVTALAGLDDLV